MFEKLKKLDTIDKTLIISTIVIMILLIGNLIMSIRHISQFNTMRQSGNDRLFEIEDAIMIYEYKINQLEEIIESLK